MDFFGDAFESGEGQGGELAVWGEVGVGGVVDEDLAGGGDAAEAGGEIDAVTEDGVVESFFGTHAAGDDGAGGDADADFEWEMNDLVELAAGFAHGEGAADGAEGVVCGGFGGAEEDHDHVAHKFVDGAAVLVGDLGECGHVLIQEVDDLMGGQLFADRGEATDIAEEHGDVFLDAAEVVVVVDEAVGDGGVGDGAENGVVAIFEGEVGGHFVEGGGEQADFVL